MMPQAGSVARIAARLHLDIPLLVSLLIVMLLGSVALYSAVGESMSVMMRQGMRIGAALVAMLLMAQIDPAFLRRVAPWLYAAGLVLLGLVLVTPRRQEIHRSRKEQHVTAEPGRSR